MATTRPDKPFPGYNKVLMANLLKKEVNRFTEKKIFDFMRDYFNGSIIVLGVCFNLLALLVLQRKAFRGSPSRLLLSLLAVVDLCILFRLVLPKFVFEHVESFKALDENSEIICKLAMYKNYVLIHLGPWTLALLTLQRFACIVCPGRLAYWFTGKKLLVMWVTLLVLCCAVCSIYFVKAQLGSLDYIHPTMQDLFRSELKYSDCGFHPDFAQVYRFVYAGFQYFLPTAIFIPCNFCIIYSLFRGNKALHKHLKREGDERRARQERSAGLVCLVTLVYLVLMTPGTVLLLIDAPSTGTQTLQAFIRRRMYYEIVSTMYFLNSAIKFAIYMVSASFRTEVWAMCFGGCRVTRKHQDVDGMTCDRSEISFTEAGKHQDVDGMICDKSEISITEAGTPGC